MAHMKPITCTPIGPPRHWVVADVDQHQFNEKWQLRSWISYELVLGYGYPIAASHVGHGSPMAHSDTMISNRQPLTINHEYPLITILYLLLTGAQLSISS